MTKQKTKVLSLGGSMIHPENIDEDYLISFKRFIDGRIKKGERFILICGGGSLARKAQIALMNTSNPPKDCLDWAGIMATRLNAEVIRGLFYEEAYEKVVIDPTKFPKTQKKVVVASGWKPGWSTDYVSVLIATKLGIREVYNLSNVEYVYTHDPKKNKNAKMIKKIDWGGFIKIVGKEWVPGKNTPFDPIASNLAQKKDIKVMFLKGKDLSNMKDCFDGKKFKGTVIH